MGALNDSLIRVSTHSRPKAAAHTRLWPMQPMMFQHTAARRRLLLTQWIIPIFTMFQHTAARRRLHHNYNQIPLEIVFQHTAARRRLRGFTLWRTIAQKVSTHSRPKAAANCISGLNVGSSVSTHSRPKAAATFETRCPHCIKVSTHSRPKAAAFSYKQRTVCFAGFNTQPPEGGCSEMFGWLFCWDVSTHSRPKAAATIYIPLKMVIAVSTHSRPKAAANGVLK